MDETWIVQYVFAPFDGTFSSIGSYLLRDMALWAQEHADLSANNTEFSDTQFKRMGIGFTD